MKELYRYDTDLSTEDFEPTPCLTAYKVKKETEKGYWIQNFSRKRFVLKGGNGKRFAYESKELALNGFIKRKERQIEINKVMMARAKKQMEVAKDLLNKTCV